MFVPFNLSAFYKIFTLSLYLGRLHIIVRRLLPLFVLICLLDVRCALSISIGHSKPSFSWNTSCNFSLLFPLSPMEFLLAPARISLIVIYLFNSVFDIFNSVFKKHIFLLCKYFEVISVASSGIYIYIYRERERAS